MEILGEAAVFLCAAIVAVPLFRRLGFGAVLGYLAAGVVIGPWGLRLVGGAEGVLHLAELGVVMLLFIIGLELQPSRLRVMRRAIFGLGLRQVVATGAALAAIAAALGSGAGAAALVGLALAMSSTAFVLQMLAERSQLATRHGRSAFAVLLFQDLAVIPILALLPVFSGESGGQLSASALLAEAGRVVVAVAAIVIGGRWLLRPALRAVARWGTSEAFTAAALLVVVAAALAMEWVGLSMALGAFLAGVLLAESEYRHELEANIEPFKGLLLGLFFMGVGLSADIGLLLRSPHVVLALVLLLIVVKSGVLYVLGRRYGLDTASARNLALALAQGGEFAFVLFNEAVASHLLDPGLANLLVLVVTLSMAATPLLFVINDRLLEPRARRQAPEPIYDEIRDTGPVVVIAGFGRFGQIVGRLLLMKKIAFTALESSSTQVDFVRRFGNRVYYGDASRVELLRAAGVDRARIFVLAIDDVETSVRTAGTVLRHFPRVRIYARARNRTHALRLMDLGIPVIVRETFLSALKMAEDVLQGLGRSGREAREAAEAFRRHDEATLLRQHAVHHDEQRLVQTSREAMQELEELFSADSGRQADSGTAAASP